MWELYNMIPHDIFLINHSITSSLPNTCVFLHLKVNQTMFIASKSGITHGIYLNNIIKVRMTNCFSVMFSFCSLSQSSYSAIVMTMIFSSFYLGLIQYVCGCSIMRQSVLCHDDLHVTIQFIPRVKRFFFCFQTKAYFTSYYIIIYFTMMCCDPGI